MKVLVVGAGAAGLFAAYSAATHTEAKVTVAEKNEKAGKKIYITGKGRCNLTNLCTPREFLDNVVRNPKFLYSAIYGFTPEDTVDFFEKNGLKLKTERGNRVFPVSDKASDVTKTLRAAAENGDLQNITGGQNNAAASQLNRVLSDPEAAKKLLSTPAAQKLFEALGGKK